MGSGAGLGIALISLIVAVGIALTAKTTDWGTSTLRGIQDSPALTLALVLFLLVSSTLTTFWYESRVRRLRRDADEARHSSSREVQVYLPHPGSTEPRGPRYVNRHISNTVRGEVWARDRGQCQECKSDKNLQFDHIIPVSKGGGNTAQNIQLLCAVCNKRKSNHI